MIVMITSRTRRWSGNPPQDVFPKMSIYIYIYKHIYIYIMLYIEKYLCYIILYVYIEREKMSSQRDGLKSAPLNLTTVSKSR